MGGINTCAKKFASGCWVKNVCLLVRTLGREDGRNPPMGDSTRSLLVSLGLQQTGSAVSADAKLDDPTAAVVVVEVEVASTSASAVAAAAAAAVAVAETVPSSPSCLPTCLRATPSSTRA